MPKSSIDEEFVPLESTPDLRHIDVDVVSVLVEWGSVTIVLLLPTEETVEVHFENVLAQRSMDESFRTGTWVGPGEDLLGLYRVNRSAFVASILDESGDRLSDFAYEHYCLNTSALCVDVIGGSPPRLRSAWPQKSV